MITADEARQRDLGFFRGLVYIAVPSALAWSPFIALLISRAT